MYRLFVAATDGKVTASNSFAFTKTGLRCKVHRAAEHRHSAWAVKGQEVIFGVVQGEEVSPAVLKALQFCTALYDMLHALKTGRGVTGSLP